MAAVAAERFENGVPHHGAAHDTRLAVSPLVFQANAWGCTPFRGPAPTRGLRTSLGVPDSYRPLSVTAAAALSAAGLLPHKLRDRRKAPPVSGALRRRPSSLRTGAIRSPPTPEPHLPAPAPYRSDHQHHIPQECT
ncbi:hypothetical protein GCM10019016_104220 [Streptomyces prasinosporus]|uniref:Uncharacterized protein n=1 Tax=Streptomyces prasinosporus TaxID=68256 RepID=A0ABP6U6W6_9ACTN